MLFLLLKSIVGKICEMIRKKSFHKKLYSIKLMNDFLDEKRKFGFLMKTENIIVCWILNIQ